MVDELISKSSELYRYLDERARVQMLRPDQELNRLKEFVEELSSATVRVALKNKTIEDLAEFINFLEQITPEIGDNADAVRKVQNWFKETLEIFKTSTSPASQPNEEGGHGAGMADHPLDIDLDIALPGPGPGVCCLLPLPVFPNED